jgi:nicotinate-nucleotide adenylyltransferase
VLERLGLEKILFLPTGEHPLKKSHILAPADHRLEMTRIGVAANPRFEVCDREVKRVGVSYSVESLAELAGEYPDHELVFMVGGDILVELHLWKNWQQLLDYAHLAMMVRPEAPVDLSAPAINREVTDFLTRHQVYNSQDLGRQVGGGYHFIGLPVTPQKICSTQIREEIRQKKSIHSTTPPGVIDYINQNQLYYLSEQNDGK